jgi:hypothetical protein
MSEFRTKLKIKDAANKFSYHDKFMLMGSCFAENMGEYLENHQFQSLINPFGIIFNTASLSKIIKRIVDLTYFNENDIFSHLDVWSSFDVHSQMNKTSSSEFLKILNNQLDLAHQFLKETPVFILTLGTSWVYKHLKTNEIVANCHKIQQTQFEKKLLTVNENEYYLNEIIKTIQAFNQNIKIIMTVSPVRHIKDGFVENNWSKANLISALYPLQNKSILYFPSYEILMDELRDYRFYAEDMLHPNKIATDYIWTFFCQTYFSEETFQTMKTVAQINSMQAHRVSQPDTESYQNFKTTLENKILSLQNKYPWMF